jgi:hypothetical protein
VRVPILLFACFLGVLAHALVLANFTPAWSHGDLVFPTWMVAGIAWCCALVLARQGKLALLPVVLGAVVLRGVTLISWPDLSDDIFRYVWEGELLTRGVSPFAFAPDHSSLEGLAQEMPEIHRQINHPGISAAYPPVTQAACALVMALQHHVEVGGVFMMRLFFTLCDLLVMWPLVALLRRAGKPLGMVVAWAWSPLVVTEFAGSGHFDSLGILLLLGSLALLCRSAGARSRMGHTLLAGAILVKYIPLLALPLAIRDRRPVLRGLGVLALVALAFLPAFLLEGGSSGLFSALGNYGLNWQSSGIVHPHLAQWFDSQFAQDGSWTDARRLVRGSLGATWLLVAAWVWFRRMDPVAATGVLLGLFLVLSPTLHPWYVTWIVPFIALGRGRPWSCPWTWLALTIPLTYVTLELWKREALWQQLPVVQAVIAIPVLLLMLAAAVRTLRADVGAVE